MSRLRSVVAAVNQSLWENPIQYPSDTEINA